MRSTVLRCPRCGNENPATNRFCGTCGAPLANAAPPPTRAPGSPQTPVSATRTPIPPPPARVQPLPPPSRPAPSQRATPVEPRVAPVQPEEVPSIAGPSFLGLGSAPQTGRTERGLNLRPESEGTSRNLDYLLEDDDEEPHSGAWKFILIVVALALALGLGYLRWRNQGLSALFSRAQNTPAAQNSNPTQPDSAVPAAIPNAGSASTASQPAQIQQQPAQPPAITPAPAGTAAPPQPGSNAAEPSAAGTAPPQAAPAAPATPTQDAAPNASGNSAPAVTSAPAAAQNDVPAPAAAAPPAKTADQKAAKADSAGDTSSSDNDAADNSAAPAAVPKPKPPAAKPVDRVTEGEKYIYGRGVSQDCDRGLRLLRPAADQGSTRAMISMGSLYSTGTCTARDLPTAYRWFALALRKAPDNQTVQGDLERLWGQMTQPERQLAIKLSQ